MPLPLIPIIGGIVAAATGAYGIKKGLDAKEDFERAERIGKEAKKRHERAIENLEEEKENTNCIFVELGEVKAGIFTDQIKHLVDVVNDVIKKNKNKKEAKSILKDYEQQIDELDLPQMEAMVLSGLEIEKGLASGVASGALMGLGAYGSVGLLGAASTGTAIASLSGVAATNATLAWLGGGSLAAGGLGMAGGTALLGGIVAGPAIAITGLVMASKAEEAITKAKTYESQVEVAVNEIAKMKLVLKGLQANAREIKLVLTQLVKRFEDVKVFDDTDANAFQRMLTVGKALKQVLDTPVIEKDGSAVQDIKQKIATTTSGIIEYRG
jgi:hypothetical protein